MDSGNSSCSLNSSNGGEDDHESSSISAFLNSSSNNNTPPNIFSNSIQQPPPPLHHPHDNHHRQQQSSVDFHNHLSNYLNPFSSSRSNSLLNLDMVWHRNIINTSSSETNNSTSNNNLMRLSSSSTQQHNQNLSGEIHFSNPLVQPSLGDNNYHKKATRNPKKRTRVSRRAPTTVLTTDTSNFRAMVQEFTGIPDAPFSASMSSVFPRSRFDLFRTSSTGKQSEPPPYLLRPFPQKVNHQLPSSSTFINTTGNNIPDSDHHHSNEPQNLLNTQSLTFQHLLNPNLHQQSNDNSLRLLRRGVIMEEFSLNTNTTATTATAATTTSHGILGGSTLSNIVDTCNNTTLGTNNGNENSDDHLGSSFN